MKSKFTDPKKKAQLAASFAVIAAWAATADTSATKADLIKIREAATQLHEISARPDPATAMRHASKLVHAMDDMIDLQRELHKRPKTDADRNNNQLRTALRRVEAIRNQDVYHIQLT